MKFKIKANPHGQYYLPKEVRQELGSKLELICNTKTAVIFTEGIHPKIILQSLAVIQKDLLNLSKLQENELTTLG